MLAPIPFPTAIPSMSKRVSPPRTPIVPDTLRHTSLTPSDDSSIIELSFDYEFDSAGNYVRVSKGSSRSDHSSPPTPQDPAHALIRDHNTLSSSPPQSNGGHKPSSPVLLNSPPQRGSLSRSESYPIMTAAEQRATLQPLSNNTAAAQTRSFQRVASGPALVPTAITPGSLRSAGLPMSNGLRGTARKVSSARAGPQRVTMEQYREMDEKIRLEDEEMRTTGATLPIYEWERGEREGGGTDNEGEPSQYSKSERPSGPSPRLSSRSASTSHIDRITSALPSRASNGRVALPQVQARQITSAQSKPRLIMGGKYGPASASGSGPSTGFDKIAEVDSTVGDHGDAAAYFGEESDTGAEDPVPRLSNPLARHRSYGLVSGAISGTSSSTPALSHSGSTRPRRSASLSDAGVEDRLSLPSSSSQQHMSSRPGSSMGLNLAGSSSNLDGRARRVTIEERYRQELEQEAEMEQYERHLAEEAAEADRLTQKVLDNNPPHRKSPSPTHLSLASHSTHLRPNYTHLRRDSDSMRNTPSSSMQAQTQSTNLVTSSSPTVMEYNRLSPSTRNFPSQQQQTFGSSQTRQQSHSHRRSPTAPELGPNGGEKGGKTLTQEDFDYGAESEQEMMRDKSRERGGERSVSRQQQYQQQQQPQSSRPASALAPAQQQQQQQVMLANGRNFNVNKKMYARLDLVGKGGSSRVYRVMTPSHEIYAIKRVSLDKTDADTMSGYMNEIALLKRLDGNNRIIRLVDSEVKAGAGGSKGYLMLVMECGEIDLARLLQEQQKEPMNMVWVSYYWQQMLQAVHVIHEEKIVHSDLKPANFVLVRGQLKLIDFGIANAIANDTTNIQRDNQMGTVNYMSPEAIELPDGMRRLKVGRPSDVWSLGCILYQMVYGQPPFQHLSVFQKMKAIPDLTHIIDYPQYATPSMPTRTSESVSPPKKLDHLRQRVRGDVIMSMKACLCRNPKERAAILELLDQDWLAMKETEPPAAKPELAHDETIINPYYMRQLLQYGIKLGQQAQNAEMNTDALLKESERLVAELKTLESS